MSAGARTTCLLILLAAPVTAAPAPPEPLTAEAAVLLDPSTRQVLYRLNADRRMYPASLTKMMTALLVAEDGHLDRYITISPRAAAVGESTMHLAAGERLVLLDVLTGLLLNSANDAATACAEAVDGSVEDFVAHMNQRARQLGLKGTHFVNPTGLHDENHYSTARDLAILALHVMGRAELRPIVRMQRAVVPWPGHEGNRVLVNRNRLLARWSACDGVKTGYTHQAGRCLAASARMGDWRLIAVVLKSKDAWSDAQRLLQWGFDNYRRVALVTGDETRARIEVRGGVRDAVECVAAEDVVAVLARDEKPPEPRVDTETVEAPVAAGDVIAHITVPTPSGDRIVEMRAVEDVPQSLWAMLWTDPRTMWGALALVSAAVGVLIYAAASETPGARRFGQSAQV